MSETYHYIVKGPTWRRARRYYDAERAREAAEIAAVDHGRAHGIGCACQPVRLELVQVTRCACGARVVQHFDGGDIW
jgi:hypothetical protein